MILRTQPWVRYTGFSLLFCGLVFPLLAQQTAKTETKDKQTASSNQTKSSTQNANWKSTKNNSSTPSQVGKSIAHGAKAADSSEQRILPNLNQLFVIPKLELPATEPANVTPEAAPKVAAKPTTKPNTEVKPMPTQAPELAGPEPLDAEPIPSGVDDLTEPAKTNKPNTKEPTIAGPKKESPDSSSAIVSDKPSSNSKELLLPDDATPLAPEDLVSEPIDIPLDSMKSFDSPSIKPTPLEDLSTKTNTKDPKDDDTPKKLGDVDAEPLQEANPDPVTPEDPQEEKFALPEELIPIKARLARTLRYYANKNLNTHENNQWQIMHRIVCWGVNAEVHRGGPNSPMVNAIGWLCWNGTCKGQQMLIVDRYGIQALKAHDFQGHYGQFLAMLAQSGVRPDYPMKVRGQNYTVANLIDSEKRSCQRGMDLTFKLISLAYYLDNTDQTWRNNKGEVWNLERMIRQEISSPILRDAPCGGTHRLMSLSYAVKARNRENKPLTGEFQRAYQYLQDYHRYTLALQNRDGSFSTEWFRTREAKPDLQRRLQTTGHILEWMAFSLNEDELLDPRMIKAVDYLENTLWNYRNTDWEVGTLGHGLHALIIYHRRVYQDEIDPVYQAMDPGPEYGSARRPRTAYTPSGDLVPVGSWKLGFPSSPQDKE